MLALHFHFLLSTFPIYPMKTLATLTRHIITWAVGMLIAWLAIYLTEVDLATATAAANALVEPLVILAGFVAVILARLALPVLNKIFRRGAGEESSGASGGMLPLVVVGLGLSMAVVGTLPSCAPGLEYPVTGTLAYTDRETGAQVGLAVGSPQPAKKAKRTKITVIPAK